MQKLTEAHVYNCCEGCKFVNPKKSKVDWVRERYYVVAISALITMALDTNA